MPKVSVIAETKRIFITNPNLKVEDILPKLVEAGCENPSPNTVGSVVTDLKQTLKLLKNMGALNEDVVHAPAEKPKKIQPKSRSQRWSDACGQGMDAISELRDLQSEYEEWKDSLPENLQSSAVAEKLESVVDLSFDDTASAFEEADAVELPMGFGRD